MLNTRFHFPAIVFLALTLLGCEQEPTPQPVHEFHDSVPAFGAFVEVTLIDVSEKDTPLVMDKIRQDLNYFHYAFHPWKSGPTGRINSLLQATGEFTANPSVIPLMVKSKLYSRQSMGLFNPAIGQLIKLWGYHDDFPPEGPAPSDEAIQALIKAKPDMQSLNIDGVRISNTNPSVQLDLSGIAKGYALDTVLQHIQEMGVKNSLISSGGDHKAIGHSANGKWKMDIRDPRGPGNLASLYINDEEAVFTSGDYEKSFKDAGHRYHHILDPRTGYPALNSQSVTVVHRNGALADAAATALFIAGPEQWLKIAKRMHITQALLVDRKGKIHITPDLYKRITFSKEQPDINVVTLAE